MSQSNVIVAALIVAFLAFITARGELTKYLGFFGLGSGGGSTGAGGTVAGDANQAASAANSATSDFDAVQGMFNAFGAGL